MIQVSDDVCKGVFFSRIVPVVNHYFSPPFGRIYLELFPGIVAKQLQVQLSSLGFCLVSSGW